MTVLDPTALGRYRFEWLITNDLIYGALLMESARLVADRVCDLLDRMTLPEKVGQML